MDPWQVPKILLLGRPEIPAADNRVFFPAKGFQLLALLSLAAGHRLKRRVIANLLWESTSDALAFANLRQLISRIRKTLSADSQVLKVDASEIALANDQISAVDLCRFEASCRPDVPNGAYVALSLFRGELLEEIDEVSAPFADWLAQSRTALRERLFAAAETVLTDITRYGRATKEEIQGIGARMLSLEPEREQSYRALIEAYGRSGLFAEAQGVHQSLIEMLATEHGVGPSPETAATVRRVFAAAANVSAGTDRPMAAVNRPRVAFLAPAWLIPTSDADVLQALVEDVSNELARYRGFVVLAPHSSFQVKHDSGMPVDNSMLHANYTVSGFVKPDPDELMLALRMADCATGEIVWTGEFSFASQELRRSFRALSSRVASSLASGLDADLRRRAPTEPAVKAYQLFLRGQACMATCDLPHLRRARKAFEETLAVDSNYAAAQARLAQTLYLEWLIRGADIPEIIVAARQRAQLASDIDPNDGLGHWISGAIAFYQRQFEESAERFSIAETLSPHSADLLVEHANALSHLGRIDAGARKFERAVSINPMPPDHYWWVGASIAFNAGDMRRTIELSKRLENEEPVLRLLTASYALAGEHDIALSYAERLRESYPGQTAADMVGISPDSDPAISERFIQGLRLAGVM